MVVPNPTKTEALTATMSKRIGRIMDRIKREILEIIDEEMAIEEAGFEPNLEEGVVIALQDDAFHPPMKLATTERIKGRIEDVKAKYDGAFFEEELGGYVTKGYQKGSAHGTKKVRVHYDALTVPMSQETEALRTIHDSFKRTMEAEVDTTWNDVIRGVEKGFGDKEYTTHVRDTIENYFDPDAHPDMRTIRKINPKARAVTAIRSFTLQAFNSAALDRYAEYTDKYEYQANAGACSMCSGHDGEIYEMGKGGPMPPLHPRCRCTTLPYFDPTTKPLGGSPFPPGAPLSTMAKRLETAKRFRQGAPPIVKPVTYPLVKRPPPTPKSKKAKAAKYRKAKTVAEGQKIAMASGIPDKVDFGKLHVETINIMNKSLYAMSKRYPLLKKTINFWGSGQAQNRFIRNDLDPLHRRRSVSGRTYAHQTRSPKHPIYGRAAGIAVNEKFGSDPKLFREGLKRDVATKFHPPGCDTIKSVIDHEIGHAIDEWLGVSTDVAITEIRKRYPSVSETTTAVSAYAAKNGKEFIAECWTEYHNNPNPRPVAVEVYEIVEMRLNDASAIMASGDTTETATDFYNPDEEVRT